VEGAGLGDRGDLLFVTAAVVATVIVSALMLLEAVAG
jgi:hypothetical protein